jgi:hypothetical protein
VEWREQTLQTTALLALAGKLDEVEPDAHLAFDDQYRHAAPPPRQDPEERKRIIAQLATE